MSRATAKSEVGRTRPSAMPLAYAEIYRASPSDRIRLIREGVPARQAKRLTADLRLDQNILFDALNLKTATVNRKAARGEALSPEDGERVIGMARLVGQLEAMLAESGNTEEFDAPAWLAQWLRTSLPALGGVRPIELLDTMEGQSLVAQALARIQSGAYA